MTLPNDTANIRHLLLTLHHPQGPNPACFGANPPRALVHSCPPQSCQAPLGTMHTTYLLAGLLFLLLGGLLHPTSIQGKKPRVLQDPKCPRSRATSRTSSTSPSQSGCRRLASYPAVPTVLSSWLYFEFLSFLLDCHFLKIFFTSGVYCLT